MKDGATRATVWWGSDRRTLYALMDDEVATAWRAAFGVPAWSAEPVAVLRLPAPEMSAEQATAALIALVPAMMLLLHMLVDELLMSWGAEHYRECSPSTGGYHQPPHAPGSACACPPPPALSAAREFLATVKPRDQGGPAAPGAPPRAPS